MCDWFIKHHGPGVHIADILLKGHGFGLAGLMVLKGILWAVSSLVSPDGLERRSCHDIWASSELFLL